MRMLVVVGCGGLLGTWLRYGLGVWVVGRYPQQFFLATWLVNIVGCLLIGYVHAFFMAHADWPPEWRTVIVVGVLGGFTTFSSFSLDTLRLLENGQVALALGYAASSILGGLLAAALGVSLGR